MTNYDPTPIEWLALFMCLILSHIPTILLFQSIGMSFFKAWYRLNFSAKGRHIRLFNTDIFMFTFAFSQSIYGIAIWLVLVQGLRGMGLPDTPAPDSGSDPNIQSFFAFNITSLLCIAFLCIYGPFFAYHHNPRIIFTLSALFALITGIVSTAYAYLIWVAPGVLATVYSIYLLYVTAITFQFDWRIRSITIPNTEPLNVAISVFIAKLNIMAQSPIDTQQTIKASSKFPDTQITLNRAEGNIRYTKKANSGMETTIQIGGIVIPNDITRWQ